MLKLPSSLRARLKAPLGKILHTKELAKISKKKRRIISVGDATLAYLLKSRIAPALAIFDFRVQRKKAPFYSASLIQKAFANPVKIKNKAGTISKSALQAIKKALSSGRRSALLVEGEEDLLALPAIAYAPADSLILYGQPKKGIVGVEANRKTKKKVRRMLSAMKKKRQ